MLGTIDFDMLSVIPSMSIVPDEYEFCFAMIDVLATSSRM